MKDKILSRALQVDDSRAAAAFSDPQRRHLVLLLAARERSLAEMAEATAVDLKRLHYHISELVKLGLVVVSGQRRRAGRPIKLYRAVADAFFVPEAAMPVSPGAARSAELRRSLDKLHLREQSGMLYHLGDRGEAVMRTVRASASGKPAKAAEIWRVLSLSHSEMLELVADIDKRLKAAAARNAGKEKPYLVHFAIAPRQGSSE